MTPTEPKIRVEINEKQNLITSHTPRSQKDRTPIRQRHQTISPVKTPLPDQSNRKRYFLKSIIFSRSILFTFQLSTFTK